MFDFNWENFLDPDFVCRVGIWLIIFQLILNTDLELLPTNCIVFIFRFSIIDITCVNYVLIDIGIIDSIILITFIFIPGSSGKFASV